MVSRTVTLVRGRLSKGGRKVLSSSPPIFPDWLTEEWVDLALRGQPPGNHLGAMAEVVKRPTCPFSEWRQANFTSIHERAKALPGGVGRGGVAKPRWPASSGSRCPRPTRRPGRRSSGSTLQTSKRTKSQTITSRPRARSACARCAEESVAQLSVLVGRRSSFE